MSSYSPQFDPARTLLCASISPLQPVMLPSRSPPRGMIHIITKVPYY